MAGTSRTAPEDRGGSMSRDGRPDPATEALLAHRNLLFTVAYEMLGSAADAEDVLQETWLRWAGVDLGTVRDQRAYLVQITTRQALSRLRTLGRRKESYVGPWLPEPLLTAPDVAEDVELADSVSMAMLLAAASTGQRLPGADPPPQRRDRRRRGGTHRRGPYHRVLCRTQSREAVTHRPGDHPAPLSPGRLGPDYHRAARATCHAGLDRHLRKLRDARFGAVAADPGGQLWDGKHG
jgi:Sigma-70 region 2